MNDRPVSNLRWRYVVVVAITVIACLVLSWWFCRGTPTTVILVRHADRDGAADAINAAGTTRANELAHVLAKSGISAIYTSEAVRTQQTAAPIAGLLGIVPAAVPAADVAGLVSTIRSSHRGQKVLVVGHSDTVPQIITELGGPTVTIGGTEFDNLYVLTLCRCRWTSVSLAELQYGAISP